MTDKLLTRRQILSIFGGATGAAIVGTTQADLGSDGQGNLYGGTANMANLYQVGPGLWKGPLSVRSDVPKEDGHDFIQTDAGDDGNLFAIHHYDGGWDEQGLSAKTVSTEESHIDRELSTGYQQHDTLDAGIYYWFTDPRFIGPNHDRVTVNKSFYSYMDDLEGIKIKSVDEDTGEEASEVLVEEFDAGDDHANPSILVRQDGHIMVFYSAHGGNFLHYHVSNDPQSVAGGFGSQQSISAENSLTYPRPYQFSDGRIRVYVRDGDSPSDNAFAYFDSTDNGSTWSRTGIAPQVNYYKTHQHGDKIFFGGLQGHPRESYSDLNFAVYDYTTDEWRDASGSLIGTSADYPLSMSDFETVHSVGSNATTWVWDCAADDDGNPAIVYAKMGRPEYWDHEYRYARHVDGEWLDVKIAGEVTHHPTDWTQQQYSPGIILNHSDPSEVYMSRGDQYSSQVEKWTTPDKGETWQHKVVADPAKENIRPVVPRGHHPNSKLVYLHGQYTEFKGDGYDMELIVSDGETTVRGPQTSTQFDNKTIAKAELSSDFTLSSGSSFTTIPIDGTDYDWYDDFDDQWNQINVQGSIGIYTIAGSVRVEDISAAGTIEAQVYDEIQGVMGGTLDVVKVEAGDTAILRGSFPVMKRRDRANPKLRVKQNTGSNVTVVADEQDTHLTVLPDI